MCALGLPGWTYLSIEDPMDRALLLQVAAAASRRRDQERKAQAVDTVNALVKALKKRK